MLDTATLASCTGASVARATLFVDSLNEAMQAYEINSTARQAAFLSEIGYESGYLVYTTELWGPTPVQQGYEGRADLGNTQPGDGPLFRGRGLIMITGRANYTAAAEALCLDCVNQPTLLVVVDAWSKYAGGCGQLRSHHPNDKWRTDRV